MASDGVMGVLVPGDTVDSGVGDMVGAVVVTGVGDGLVTLAEAVKEMTDPPLDWP